MKLRFEVNQAECLRRGIDAPDSTVVIHVDPALLTQAQRDLIADHLFGGIDICRRYDDDSEASNIPLKVAGNTLSDVLDAIVKHVEWRRRMKEKNKQPTEN